MKEGDLVVEHRGVPRASGCGRHRERRTVMAGTRGFMDS